LTLNQARQAVAYAALEDGRFSREDLARIVERKARLIQDSGLLEYFPPRDNAFELGGFARLGEWLERAEQGFTAEARALGLAPPRGLLLAGVQGCGKSLAAKVIARRWGQPLLKLDAGRLYDKYVGESDKNLRRALALAESMAPAVLWIDEIEKAFGAGGDGDVDGGLSRRIQGHLLTWLQEKSSAVFVVATANDVFALPPELMRKGRFDEIFFVDLPRPDERRTIFEIHLRGRGQDPVAFTLDDLVLASEGMSGAEIEQAVVAGLYRALHAKQPLADAHLLAELDATVPLSRSRREDVSRLRALAAERFVPVA
ncbi:MAG TPA: AAA family ATPase, partial [Myxococcota bacterium]|nr:AAA family ATPase [Myxococcota bacterium]